jgi:LuxR family maltose regulon positive regulatory protein
MAKARAPVRSAYDALLRPPLLTTKLYLPPARSHLVPRPRLIERLNAGLTRRLTLISAPAGFGKTTLLSAWIPQSARCVAWVSLDEGDNDPTRFWSYFISAVQMLDRHLGQNALRLLQSPQPPPFDFILTALLNDVTAFRQGFALVLDDYHLIENPAIHQALTFLLEHLPAQVHLIMTTRVDPPLPLSRLRGRGQLLELGVADLRFTWSEVTTFLNEVMGLPLTAQDIAALEQRTEGWIAGLQLAALAMRDQTNLSGFVSAFTGSNRFVVDYLVTEVLARQPAHVQTFLLQTAILERLCGPLCDGVMGIEEAAQPPSSCISPPAGQPALAAHSYSQMLLEALERAHLFLLPLDNDRRWYRYHHLFAEVLRGRLVRGATAEMVALLHRRAAAWYEQNGLLVEAIQHALAAADFEQAARLIEQVALPVMLPGQVHTLLGWLKALPETLLQTSPALCIVHGSALVFINQMEAAEARLQAAEQAVLREPRSDWADLILGRAAASRGALLRFCGDLARCAAFSHQALDLLPETEFMWLVARLNAAYAFLVNGEVTPATERRVAEVIALIRPTHNSYILLRSMTLLARLQTLQGRLRQAAATYQEAAQVAPEQPGAQVVLNSSSYYFGLGDLLREWNELEAAERHLKQGLDMLSGAMAIEAEVATLGYMALARLKQAQGDRDGALATVRALAELAQQRDFFPPLIERGTALEARLQLVQGDLEAARRWVEQRELTADDSESVSYLHEMEYLTLVRVLIALGKQERRGLRAEDTVIHPAPEAFIPHPLEDAMRVLDRLLPVAEASGRTSSSIEILSLRALALQAQGNLTQALAALERALILAESEGYVRIFVDEGKPMAELLSRLNASFDGSTPRGQVLNEYVHKLLGSFGMRVGVQVANPTPLLAEPLSDRELEVLRLLAAGLTNQEIADQLLIALGTAKRHTINIYGKLGVSNRTQAVAKARELNLL